MVQPHGTGTYLEYSYYGVCTVQREIKNLIFAPTHLSISLSKRKNDQFRERSQDHALETNPAHKEWIQTPQGADVIQ